MIWCFGFFFLELLDDCDEESNNDDALASLDDADRKLGSDSDKGHGLVKYGHRLGVHL